MTAAAVAPADEATGCTCTPPWPGLAAQIDGEIRPAEATAEHHAAETVGDAYCTGCGIAYPGHWTLTKVRPTGFVDGTDQPGGEAAGEKPVPKSATDLLRLIVAERPNGEVRPQQERMVELVEKAIKGRTHLLVQAGTGTGKSLGYLIPAIASGKRVVVSTATKQLGEQIVNEDMPVLADLIPKVGGKPFTYALIKGRNNYACLREIDSLVRLDAEGGDEEVQDALFADPTPRENSRRPSVDDLKKLNSLLQWADTTETGDRSDAPGVPDRVWEQVSTDAAGCTGKACPFYEQCFAEAARAKAREVDVVVTNHAQVAQDLRSEFPLLGDWDVLVTDEVHELESYLSSAWGLEVAPNAMKHHLAQALRKMSRSEKYEQAREIGKKALEDLDALAEMLDSVEAGLLPEMPETVGNLLVEIAKKQRIVVDGFELCSGEKNVSSAVAAERKGAGQKVAELCVSVVSMCADMSDGTNVRWLESGFGNRGPALKVAPLWIGPRLMELLDDRTLVATSATITVGGSFDSFIRTLALREERLDAEGNTIPPRKFDAVDVGTPFDYDKQAILYIPDNKFPAPQGQERAAHTEAVKDEVTALVKAAGGRTLALFTTRRGAEAAAAHLRSKVNTPILCQGEAPPSQLIEEFREDEHATLCATMGFWHGVNAPGATCFPAGTLVRTSRGYKPIEEIQVGDKVWTHKRRYRKVTTLMSRQYSGDMVTVTPFGAPPVSMTPEHPVLVSDYKRQPDRLRQHATSQRWVEAGDLTGKENLVLPIGDWFTGFKPIGRKHITGHRLASDDQSWVESPEFWELVGLWAAEGSISREEMPRKRAGAHKVRWQIAFGFGSHEEETIAARAADLIAKVFGVNRPRPRVYGSACHVTFRHDGFAHWLKRNVGHLATGKKVPVRLLRSYHTDYKRAFLDGYNAGDGSIDHRDGSYEILTASIDLALGVRDLALMCGFTASLYSKTKHSEAAFNPNGVYWRVRWQPGRSNRAALVTKRGSDESSVFDTKYMVARPRKVERSHYEGVVYNLSVEDDESYTLVGFAVHNCSVVVLDKAPFAPMNDPLMSARRKAVDEAGRRGFDEVYVAGASVMLSQGVGRLIRTATDKGVVAILDTRLTTKGYGRTMISSMPPMRLFRDRAVIEQALTRLAAVADEALGHTADSGSGDPATPSGVRQSARVAAAQQAAATTEVPRRKAAPRKSHTRSLGKPTKI